MFRMRLADTPATTSPIELSTALMGTDIVFKTGLYALKIGGTPDWETYVRKTRSSFDVFSVHYVRGIPTLSINEGSESTEAGAIGLAKTVKKESRYV